MLVIGTAGHIDHGKTSLVNLLTGQDLDTLPEERERGITIALGFAPLDLPDGRRAALVDVPGHERLIRTMVAGATGLQAVMLVVSAVDGVMPQTREHLAILGLLGVERGLVALSMADLVDDELLELAIADVEDAVAGTFLQDAPILPTSVPEKRGREEILAYLATLPDPVVDPTGPFRLPVDRAFSRPGFGTVVTGTSWSGTLEDGDTVRLAPSDTTARVRGIQVQGESAPHAPPRARVALNLAGIETSQVPRGTTIVRGTVPDPHMIDGLYRHLADAPPLRDGSPVRVLLGTAEVMGRIHIAADEDVLKPGMEIPVQLRLDSPLPCLHGDRFIVRRSSPMETLGGGIVADPYTRRMRTRDRERMGQETRDLANGSLNVWLLRAGDVGLSAADWKARGGTGGTVLGGRVFAKRVVARLQGLLLEALSSFHDHNPLALGAHRRELHRERLSHLDNRVFDDLVESLSQAAALRFDGPLVRVAAFEVELTTEQTALQAELLDAIEHAGHAGLAPAALHTAFPQPEAAALLRLLESDDTIESVAGIGWITANQRTTMRDRVREWFDANETLSPGDFKELTGLTRKTAIPWLEYLDRRRDTAFGPSGRRTRGSQL